MAKARKKLIPQRRLSETDLPAFGMFQRWNVAALCFVLAVITFAVFGQTLQNGFLNFDDGAYVYENAHVAGGLSWKGLAWVFTHADCNFYHPLTMLSLMADYQIYGLRSGGYHFTNVLLHAASVILLFLVFHQMTGAVWRSAFVAAVFAIHPLRVESVAWVSERKDVLGTFFFMLTLAAYVHYVRKPKSLARYLMVAVAFVLALLSKPTAVTLPFVLLLLDYWPLNRFEQPRKLPGLILEKIPLLALAAGAGVMTFLAEGEAVATLTHVSMSSRFGNALVSYAIYLRQMVWPDGLVIFYPLPEGNHPVWTIGLSFLLLALISWGVIAFRRKRPWLLTGWLWYLGMLLPMIGLVQVGGFAHADRMTYLPQIGIYVALTWLMAEWLASRVALGCLMTGVLALLMFFGWKQTAYWKDSETLWTHALACTTRNGVAHYNLGDALFKKGQLDDAIIHFQKALETNPGDVAVHVNLGNVLLQKGRVDEAIAEYQNALQINPGHAAAHCNLGSALYQAGRLDEAMTQFQKALQTKPDYTEALNGLGSVLLQKGRADEAIAQYQAVLQIDPKDLAARINLGNTLAQKGRMEEAITQYRTALQIKPDDADAHLNLGSVLLQKGEVDEAITQFQQALQIRPDFENAHCNLGAAFSQKGRTAEAITQYEEALQLGPVRPAIEDALAWLLATSPQASLRNGEKALQLARQANDLDGGKNPVFLHTLAAAFAEVGRFGDARENVQKAIELAQAAGRPDLAAQLNVELKQYEANLPIRQ